MTSEYSQVSEVYVFVFYALLVSYYYLYPLTYAFWNYMLDMISIGTLLAFTVVCASVIVQRYEGPSGIFGAPSYLLLYMILSVVLTKTLSSFSNITSYSVAAITGVGNNFNVSICF